MGTNENYSTGYRTNGSHPTGNQWNTFGWQPVVKPSSWQPMETIWMGTNENYSTDNSLKPSGWQPMETLRLAVATNGNHPTVNQFKPSGWEPTNGSAALNTGRKVT
jgi:hypothetical protein